MKVYKTVQREDDGFRSFAIPKESKYCLRYAIGKKTVPVKGAIFAWPTADEALCTITDFDQYVLECEATPTTFDHRTLVNLYFALSAKDLDALFDRYYNNNLDPSSWNIDPATVFCSEVTPLRVIEFDEVVE